MSEQVRRLPPTPPVAPLKVPPHETNVNGASPKLRSTQSMISPRGQPFASPRNTELSRIATLVGTFAAMEQQNSPHPPGSPHPNQPPVPTKKAPPIPNRPKSITLDHGIINSNNPPLSPNSNAPKVAAKGPLPKRPSHAPPPPPKSVNGAPAANSNNEDESSASDSTNSDSVGRNYNGPSSDGNSAVRKTTGPPRVFQSRVQNALAASDKNGNDRRASDDTVSPRSAGNSPNIDRKSRRMSISGLTSPRGRGNSNESSISSSTDTMPPPKAASEMHSIDLETGTKKRKLSVSSANLSPEEGKTKRSSKAFVKSFSRTFSKIQPKGLFAKVSESVKRTHSKTKGDHSEKDKDKTDKDKSSNNTDDVSAQEEEAETFEDPLAQMSEEDWVTQKRPKREWPVVDATLVPKDFTGMVDPRCTSLGYYIEFGVKGAPTTPHLAIEYGDLDIFFYRDLMCSVDHVNFVGESAEGEPPGAVVVSVERSKKNERLKCIIRTKRGHDRVILEVPEGKSVGKALSNIAELSTVKLSKVRNPALQELLVDMERKELIMYGNYKFGVLYWRDGLSEDEMFAQTAGSADYDEFLAWLGDRITLFGWDKYRGGLDTKNKSTGEYSVYKEVLGKEIMFHVSTLLPSQEQDVQRVERKRHIGNDVVVIIFKDGKQPFDPLILTNQFNHIFAIVEKLPGTSPTKYKLVIVNKVGTVPSVPELPFPPVFEKTDAFRQFFLTKLINAERAAMQSPEFKGKMMRTRKEELSNIVGKSREMKDKKEQPSLDSILGGVKDLISKAAKNVNDKIEKRDSKKMAAAGNSDIAISTPQFVQHKHVVYDPNTNQLTQ